MYTVLKILGSAVLIYLISEIAKRSSFIGAVLASLPLISILAFVFLYEETKDAKKITALSTDIFWLVIPSLVLFVALPHFLKKGISFYPSLSMAIGLTIAAYFLMSLILKKLGIL